MVFKISRGNMPRDVISRCYQRASFEVAIFKISWGSMPRDVVTKCYQKAPFEVHLRFGL